MKNGLIIILTLSTIFLFACQQTNSQNSLDIVAGKIVAVPNKIKEDAQLDCPARFRRGTINEDGSVEIYCASPEQLGLKKYCSSNLDCLSLEECIDNYCTVVEGGDFPCTKNNQCPSGMICKNNFCITR